MGSVNCVLIRDDSDVESAIHANIPEILCSQHLVIFRGVELC